MKQLLSILTLLLLAKDLVASILCGYNSTAGEQIKNALDQCFRDNVIDTRARMAIGFEYCFGINYQILNQTVEIPYRKKITDTQKQISSLAENVCSDNDDALDQFVFSTTVSATQNADGISDIKDKSVVALNRCRKFFAKIKKSIENENYEVVYILRQNEELIQQTYPDPNDRKKIFSIIQNIVQPLISCFEPMETMKAEFIRQYLRMYLTELVRPTHPSFDEQTYEILMNPEYYAVQDYDASGIFKSKRSIFDLDLNARIVNPTKTVLLKQKRSSELTPNEKQKVILFDQQNSQKLLSERDNDIQKAIVSGKVTRTQVLAMTPKQKLAAGLMTQEDYRSQVAMDEDHSYFSRPIEIDRFWDANLSMKKIHYSNEDYNRYKIKGFDIDQKIQELFKI